MLGTGGGEVRVRWFDGDIGAVGVELDGAWHEVPAVPDALRGVDASTWMATRRALSARDPERHRWNGDIVLDAIRDITEMNASRAAAYGILDHAWTPERLESAEREALAPFDVAPAGDPGNAANRGCGRDVEPLAPEPERDAPEGP